MNRTVVSLALVVALGLLGARSALAAGGGAPAKARPAAAAALDARAGRPGPDTGGRR